MKKWELKRVIIYKNDSLEYSDILLECLEDGWEPFSAVNGNYYTIGLATMWLKRQVEDD